MIRFLGRGKTLTLRSPEISNTIEITTGLIIKRSMNRKPKSFRRTPVQYKITLQFANMNRPKILEVQSFIDWTKGLQVKYVDFLGKTWLGNITSNPIEYTHQGLRNNVFSIILEGTYQ